MEGKDVKVRCMRVWSENMERRKRLHVVNNQLSFRLLLISNHVHLFYGFIGGLLQIATSNLQPLVGNLNSCNVSMA